MHCVTCQIHKKNRNVIFLTIATTHYFFNLHILLDSLNRHYTANPKNEKKTNNNTKTIYTVVKEYKYFTFKSDKTSHITIDTKKKKKYLYSYVFIQTTMLCMLFFLFLVVSLSFTLLSLVFDD